jgi:Tn3 transposase DDE domain
LGRDELDFVRRYLGDVNRHSIATLLSLQLLQNCLMLVNTLLVERTLDKHGLWDRLNFEDLRALTPLFHTHINRYGVFQLDLESPSFLMAA